MIMLYPNTCDIEVVLCKNNLHKIGIIFLSISLNICFGAQKNHHIETVLLSTHSICFG